MLKKVTFMFFALTFSSLSFADAHADIAEMKEQLQNALIKKKDEFHLKKLLQNEIN